jgi:transposase-like protein
VLGAPWQRTVHFLREALGHARREQQPMLAALIRPIFNAESGEQAGELLGEAIARLERPLPKVAAMLERAEEDLLAFDAFPVDHWRKLRKHQPVGAAQPRDRAPYRRRRHLPRRPLADPARDQPRDRAERLCLRLDACCPFGQ